MVELKETVLVDELTSVTFAAFRKFAIQWETNKWMQEHTNKYQGIYTFPQNLIRFGGYTHGFCFEWSPDIIPSSSIPSPLVPGTSALWLVLGSEVNGHKQDVYGREEYGFAPDYFLYSLCQPEVNKGGGPTSQMYLVRPYKEIILREGSKWRLDRLVQRKHPVLYNLTGQGQIDTGELRTKGINALKEIARISDPDGEITGNDHSDRFQLGSPPNAVSDATVFGQQVEPGSSVGLPLSVNGKSYPHFFIGIRFPEKEIGVSDYKTRKKKEWESSLPEREKRLKDTEGNPILELTDAASRCFRHTYNRHAMFLGVQSEIPTQKLATCLADKWGYQEFESNSIIKGNFTLNTKKRGVIISLSPSISDGDMQKIMDFVVNHHREETESDLGFGVIVLMRDKPDISLFNSDEAIWRNGPFDLDSGIWAITADKEIITCENLQISELRAFNDEWSTGSERNFKLDGLSK